jgi:hypothetical protein
MGEYALFSKFSCSKIIHDEVGDRGVEHYQLVDGGCSDTCAPKGEACSIDINAAAMTYKILN